MLGLEKADGILVCMTAHSDSHILKLIPTSANPPLTYPQCVPITTLHLWHGPNLPIDVHEQPLSLAAVGSQKDWGLKSYV